MRVAHPAPTAPAKSITDPIIMACLIVRDLDATDVAKILETSLAPVFRKRAPFFFQGNAGFYTYIPSVEKCSYEKGR
jgi:hypothetical protein